MPVEAEETKDFLVRNKYVHHFKDLVDGKRKADKDPYCHTKILIFTFKGQLISKCPFGVFRSSKKPTKFFKGFLP